MCAIRDELTGVKWFIHWLKWSCKRSRVDIPKRHELQSIFLSFCLSVPQLVRWSWRVPAFLWRRETLWLWAAETGWTPPPISPQISTKMAASSGAALQETWASTVFLNLMKDSTSATCPEADYHQTAGWLSEVRGALKALKTTSYDGSTQLINHKLSSSLFPKSSPKLNFSTNHLLWIYITPVRKSADCVDFIEMNWICIAPFLTL